MMAITVTIAFTIRMVLMMFITFMMVFTVRTMMMMMITIMMTSTTKITSATKYKTIPEVHI
ncbi:hypothetical protein [Priestia megaterium]|uniref:hypothetical protein n=1 Tax=Priestia megaterium TaxID=1404 RepID=UPI0036D7C531